MKILMRKVLKILKEHPVVTTLLLGASIVVVLLLINVWWGIGALLGLASFFGERDESEDSEIGVLDTKPVSTDPDEPIAHHRPHFTENIVCYSNYVMHH